MATARSAERPGTATGRSRSGRGADSGSGSGYGSGSESVPPEDEASRCPLCEEAEPGGGNPPCGHPPAPRCPSRRTEERLRRRGDSERSGGRAARRDSDSRREVFVCPALLTKSAEQSSGPGGKHKLWCEDRDEPRRRKDESLQRDDIGVLSDSENEEPVRRIRNVSAFVRRTRTSSGVIGGAQRSRSCTDPVEAGAGGKPKAGARPAPDEQVGISHSFTAGILLSSENSRSVWVPPGAPDRRPAWRAAAAVWSSSAPLVLPPRAERSISPESNDSISEELNHFKPIVCSPCTPPKRLPDGRLLEPTIVKSTPRNLTRGLQRATSYEASPAVLQKWRQIELDRQNLKVTSKGTLTSPVAEDSTKTASANKRRPSSDPAAGDEDGLRGRSLKIHVPAVRYGAEAAFRKGLAAESAVITAPETCGQGGPLGPKRSFSPYVKHSGFQSCVLAPRDSQSPCKELDGGFLGPAAAAARRGRKRKQKTKHLDSECDPDPRRSRSAAQVAFDQRYIRQVQRDRVLALKLQRQFDRENQSANRGRSPDSYFLRSWMSNQNRRRRGLRRSRRINKKH